MGLLEAVEAVLPAACCRRRAVDVLLGGGGCQHPLLVLRRGQVGRRGQQLCGVVGARRVRVVGRVRRVRSTAQENPTVVLLGGGMAGRGGGRGTRVWGYLGVETTEQKMATKIQMDKKAER